MGRPKKKQESIRIVITGTPKLASYLDDLISEEGYGTTRSEVAKILTWRAIEDLVHKGIIDRRKGKHKTEDD